MLTHTVPFSKMLYGIKGDNASQVIKNIAWSVCQNLNITSTTLSDYMSDKLRASPIGMGDGVSVFDWVSDRIEKPFLACIILETPISFPSADDRPTDIVLILVSPDSHKVIHLQQLARLTRLFREPKLLETLRSVTCADGMESVLSPDNRKLLVA